MAHYNILNPRSRIPIHPSIVLSLSTKRSTPLSDGSFVVYPPVDLQNLVEEACLDKDKLRYRYSCGVVEREDLCVRQNQTEMGTTSRFGNLF